MFMGQLVLLTFTLSMLRTAGITITKCNLPFEDLHNHQLPLTICRRQVGKKFSTQDGKGFLNARSVTKQAVLLKKLVQPGHKGENVKWVTRKFSIIWNYTVNISSVTVS
jgi:hypothetical protein